MNQPLTLIYQDEILVAVNKPVGWFVHRSPLDPKVETIVLQRVRDQIGAYLYPVHRLDRPTSGLLLFALDAKSARHLADQFEAQTVEKGYLGIVRGSIGAGVTEYPLSRPDASAQEAKSLYRGIASTEIPISVGRYPSARYSLTALAPITGRQHQLRRHLKALAHPLIGDTTHGDLRHNHALQSYMGLNRLMLHAATVKITHPVKETPLLLTAPPDKEWDHFCKQLDLPLLSEEQLLAIHTMLF